MKTDLTIMNEVAKARDFYLDGLSGEQRTCIRFEAVQNTHKFGIEIKTIKKQ